MTLLTRWNPFEEIATIWPREFLGRDWFGRLHPDGGVEFEWRPRGDVSEAADAIVVHVELPSVESQDVEVSVDKGVLVIRGEKRTGKTGEDEGRKYSERFFGSFERHFPLTPETDEGSIQASMKDGVLEMRIPERG